MSERDSDGITNAEEEPATEAEYAGVEREPKDIQRVVSEFMGMAISSVGPRYHPIFKKFTPEHVDKFLDHTHQSDREERALRRSGRWFQLAYVLLGAAALVALVVYLLPRDRSLLVEVLKAIVLFAAGVGSGYGLKSHLVGRSERH